MADILENSLPQDINPITIQDQTINQNEIQESQESQEETQWVEFPSDDNNKFTIPDNGIQQPFGRQMDKPKFGGGFNAQSEKKVYGIFLNYQLPGMDKLLDVQESLHAQFTIIDTITFTIDTFNQKLKQMNSNYQLTGNADNWSLFVAKKNGKPKTDYPVLDQDSLLSECNKINFSLSPKDSEDISKCIIDKSQNMSQITKATDRESIYSQQSSQNQINKNNESDLKDIHQQYRASLVGNDSKKPKKEKQDKSGGCMSCF